MIATAPLSEQPGLPAGGREITATYDEHSVVLWQAHAAAVACHALDTGSFLGPSWRLDRVTRLRTSLPSLLTRCDWGRRGGRECILGVSVSRAGFDAMLRQAVHSEYSPVVYGSRASWRLATRYSAVSLDWVDDVDARGIVLPHQTIRLGLRGEALRMFSSEWVVSVVDWSAWAASHWDGRGEATPLPVVRRYPVEPALAERLAGRSSGEGG